MARESAVDTLARWRWHPVQFVKECFGATPDPWQADILEAFPHNQRIAMKASKGPGKSTVLAWIALNFLLTRPHPKIAATSITAENLADGLWAECAKWIGKSDIFQLKFEWQKTRIVCKDYPETWWMSARTWPKGGTASDQANTLAGLHAEYILFLLDESGGMPDAVMASAEAALAACTEGHLVQAGNPTHLAGPLYRACTVNRRLWHVAEITSDPDDPKRATRVPVEWAREQIELYGRDNPFVLVNVFGQFPPASLNVLIGPDECTAAMKRSYHEWDLRGTARILGVDVARFGDDASVIFPRQGKAAFTPLQYRNLVSHEGAGVVARKWGDWNADAVFVDDTGGYGAGWIDALTQLGRKPIGVGFAASATNPRYYNKRTEMYFDMVQWIRQGGQLPDCPELVAALTQTTYSFKGDRMLLEPKEMVKQRLGFSPDHADALGLTFAYPVAPKVERDGLMPMMQAEHDPYASMRSKTPQQMMSGYDPYSGMRGAR